MNINHLKLKCFVYAFFAQFLFITSVGAQPNSKLVKTSIFRNATVTMTRDGRAATEIRPNNNVNIGVTQFLNEYRRVYQFSEANEFRSISVKSDNSVFRHYRYKQYYKGIELAEVLFQVHEKAGRVYLAHGNPVPGIELNITPALTEKEALQYALQYTAAKRYMWEQSGKKTDLKQESAVSQFYAYPKGQLMLTAGRKEFLAENFRLVYRFDIYAREPLSRSYVDIDANTGELVNKLSQLNTGNVQGKGVSLYNDTVPITVSDENYPQWIKLPNWHPDDWNANGGSGVSWWLADTLLGNEGGYDNNWYQVLQTDTFTISGENAILSFYHRYSVEQPEVYEIYDGWDGMNVRITTDKGKTWNILTAPSVPYTCSSLYSFGFIHNEGPGIPGWAGKDSVWTKVSFDLSAYYQDTLQIRFVFASDGGLSTADRGLDLFGWQVDDILVKNASDTFYINSGDTLSIEAKNLVKEVNIIEGKYRLRETTRGMGIVTYDAKGADTFNQAEDFVDDDSIFSGSANSVGASLHWGLEETYDYFLDRYGRHGIDGEDGRLIAYANSTFEGDPNNAQWNGNFSLFGKGDSIAAGPWVSLDIIGHELTHGVTQYSAGLIYENEPGALNESFSDIFGKMVEFYVRGPEKADWIIGKDIGMSGFYVRSMEDPNLRGNPDTYNGALWTKYTNTPDQTNDNGGVHNNSGPQNFWFYLLCEGGSGTNDFKEHYFVTGIGPADAEQIAYRNLTTYLQPTSTYHEAALYSVQSAVDLFGDNSVQLQAVVDAWNAVGIYWDPKIYAPNDAFTFRTTKVKSQTFSIEIRNIGFDSLQISTVQLTGAGFTFDVQPALPVNIGWQKSRFIRVKFSPEKPDTTLGTLTISSNDPERPDKKITLKGINTNSGIPVNTTGITSYPVNYPNPAGDRVYFTHPEVIREVVVYSLSGVELIRTNLVADGIDVSGLSPGTYLAEIHSHGHKYRQKFVVE